MENTKKVQPNVQTSNLRRPQKSMSFVERTIAELSEFAKSKSLLSSAPNSTRKQSAIRSMLNVSGGGARSSNWSMPPTENKTQFDSYLSHKKTKFSSDSDSDSSDSDLSINSPRLPSSTADDEDFEIFQHTVNCIEKIQKLKEPKTSKLANHPNSLSSSEDIIISDLDDSDIQPPCSSSSSLVFNNIASISSSDDDGYDANLPQSVLRQRCKVAKTDFVLQDDGSKVRPPHTPRAQTLSRTRNVQGIKKVKLSTPHCPPTTLLSSSDDSDTDSDNPPPRASKPIVNNKISNNRMATNSNVSNCDASSELLNSPHIRPTKFQTAPSANNTNKKLPFSKTNSHSVQISTSDSSSDSDCPPPRRCSATLTVPRPLRPSTYNKALLQPLNFRNKTLSSSSTSDSSSSSDDDYVPPGSTPRLKTRTPAQKRRNSVQINTNNKNTPVLPSSPKVVMETTITKLQSETKQRSRCNITTQKVKSVGILTIHDDEDDTESGHSLLDGKIHQPTDRHEIISTTPVVAEDIQNNDRKLRNNPTSSTGTSERESSNLIQPSDTLDTCNPPTPAKDIVSKQDIEDFIVNQLKKKFTCPICKERFVTKTVLSHHTSRKHTGEKIFWCGVDNCSKSFVRKCDLYRHQRCLHASKALKITAKNAHKNSHPSDLSDVKHSTDEIWRCHICDKIMKNRRNLNLHFNTHYANEHQCDICGNKYSQKCYLKLHKTVHQEKKMFPCPECDDSFLKFLSLQKHLERFHNFGPGKKKIITQQQTTVPASDPCKYYTRQQRKMILHQLETLQQDIETPDTQDHPYDTTTVDVENEA